MASASGRSGWSGSSRTWGGYGNDSRQNGPLVPEHVTRHSLVRHRFRSRRRTKTEALRISTTRLRAGARFAIGRQTRPRFAFAETRPETGTSQETLLEPAS